MEDRRSGAVTVQPRPPGDPCIVIHAVRVSPAMAAAGEALTLSYDVENRLGRPRQVVLGATLQKGTLRTSDPAGDAAIEVRPGVATYQRAFRVPLGKPVGRAFCGSGESPQLRRGLADLRTWLGAGMGDPTECEHPVDGAGNTEQATTMGLGYYRAAVNAAVFTDGHAHWAVEARGRVCWEGGDVEPPRTARPESGCQVPARAVLTPDTYELVATVNAPEFAAVYHRLTHPGAVQIVR